MTLQSKILPSGIRVLHVISGVNTGGAERFLAELAPLLRERGISQEIYSLSGDGTMAPVFETRGFLIHKPDFGRSPLNGVKLLFDLAKVIDRFQPDIIQGWMYHGDLFALLARHLSRRRKSKLIWNIRCSDLRLEDYSLQLRIVIRGCAHFSKRPDLVIANSHAGAESHSRLGYKPRQLAILHNGIDAERYQPDPQSRDQVRAELGIDPETLLIVHVARVDPMKDHATLLRAVGGLEGTTTVLVGRGTTSFDLPRNVIALGNRTDIDRILSAGDIVASSSAFGEGFSNAVAEGMAVGLLPVATRVGDTEVLVGETGILCRPRDANEMRAAFERVRAMSPVERRALGMAARERVTSNFSIQNAADRYARIYQSIHDSDAASTEQPHLAATCT